MEKLARILVPVDASRGAAKAVKLATELALATGAVIDILHVSYFDPKTDSDTKSWLDTSILDSAADEEKLVLDRARALLPTEIQAKFHHRTGIPTDEILSFADESKADLIVVGARGLGIVESFFLGSVSQEIVERATVTVAVAK